MLMRQRGAWWKGLTTKGMEVTISHPLFHNMRLRQEHTLSTHPSYIARDYVYYGASPVCMSPQWWVDVFLDRDYAIGMQQYTWVHRRSYSKLVLGEVIHPEFDPDDVRPPGTLIFRTLPDKRRKARKKVPCPTTTSPTPA